MNTCYWRVENPKLSSSQYFGPENKYYLTIQYVNAQYSVYFRLVSLFKPGLKVNVTLLIIPEKKDEKVGVRERCFDYGIDRELDKRIGFMKNQITYQFVCIVEDVTPAPAVLVPRLCPVEFKSKFGDNLKELLLSGEMKDVTFKIGTEEITAHQVMLKARSPVLAKMFEVDMKERSSRVAEIKDCSFECFKDLLEFIYTDNCEKMDDFAAELLHLGDKYELTDLKLKAGNTLLKKINHSNALEILILFDRYRLSELKAEIIKYITYHKAEVFKQTDRDTFQKEHHQLAFELYAAIAFGVNADSIAN